MAAAMVIAGAIAIGLIAAVLAQRRPTAREIGREAAGAPPPPPDADPERKDWDDAWRSEPVRRLPARPTIDLPGWDSPIVSATISGVPVKYWDRHGSPSSTCPICGLEASGEGRIPAILHPTLENGSSFGVGVWAHDRCLQACPETALPGKIPW